MVVQQLVRVRVDSHLGSFQVSRILGITQRMVRILAQTGKLNAKVSGPKLLTFDRAQVYALKAQRKVEKEMRSHE